MSVEEHDVIEVKPVELPVEAPVETPVAEIVLEPLLLKGDLVGNDWWQPAAPEPVGFWRRNGLFIAMILLPITAAVVYFGFLTGDQFVSETHFIVRTSAHDEIGNLAALVQTQKLSRAADETYALSDFMTSRDALALVTRNGLLQRLLDRPQAGPLERFPSRFFTNNEEHLYRRFLQHVTSSTESESGISTLTVTAYNPVDAQAVATTLLAGGEQLVNRLNIRAHQDALVYANNNVATARARLSEAESRLERFRDSNRIIAPDKEASLSLQGITGLRTQLAGLNAELKQKMAVTPRSPAIASLKEQIKALRAEIEAMSRGVAGDSGSLAGKLGGFEKLMLDRTLAAKAFEASTAMLESAQRDARQQQLYVETIVAPGLPDQALYPYRILSILVVVICAFALRWFVGTLGRIVMEHRA